MAGNGAGSGLIYVLNLATKCISVMNSDSKQAALMKAGKVGHKVFSSMAKAMEYKRNH